MKSFKSLMLLVLLASPLVGENHVSCSAKPILFVKYGDILSCKLSVAGDTDAYSMAGSAGDVILIAISDNDPQANPFPIVQVELLDPIGISLGKTTTTLEAVLSVPGPYTLLVTEVGADDTPDYTLSVERLSPHSAGTPMLTFGSAARGRIDPFGSINLYSFTGNGGQTTFVQISDGDPQANPFTIATVTLFDPSGVPVETTSGSMTKKLVKSGIYTLLVAENDLERTFDYTLSIESIVPPSSNSIPICYGCTQEGKIDVVGETDLLRFTGSADDVIHLQISDGDPDNLPFPIATVELFDPTGKSLGVWAGGKEVHLSSSGTYTILVSEIGNDDTPSYHVSLQCIGGSCLPNSGDPEPPPGPWLSISSPSGYRAKARLLIGSTFIPGIGVKDCIAKTLCIAGVIPLQPDVLIRLLGPRPNGYIWPEVITFTTSQIEVWIQQAKTGITKYYKLPATPQGVDALQGSFDRMGFRP